MHISIVPIERGDVRCNVKQAFRLQFQQALTAHLFTGGTAAEGFGIIWEKTLDRVPLDDDGQGELYRELIGWAKSDELFTGSSAEAHSHGR